APAVVPSVIDNDVWVLSLEGEDLRCHQTDRRQLLAGAGAMLGFVFTRGTCSPVDEPVIATLRMSFDNCRQLGRSTSPMAILGLAARCEAQGHALAGDRDAFERSLDRATELLAAANSDGAPTLGSSSVADEASLARGWALYDLGLPAQAAAVLDGQVARIPV